MSELVGKGSKYTDEERLNAATLYAAMGSISAVSRETNIPRTTINQWAKCEWWLDHVVMLRHEKQEQHITLYHDITMKSLEKARKAVDGLGDELSASDIKALVVTGATATDKARLLMNQPTSISASDSSMSKRLDLLEAFARDRREKQARVVATQITAAE